MKEREKEDGREREREKERERGGNYAKMCAVTRTVRVKTLISVIPW